MGPETLQETGLDRSFAVEVIPLFQNRVRKEITRKGRKDSCDEKKIFYIRNSQFLKFSLTKSLNFTTLLLNSHHILKDLRKLGAFPGGSVVKNPPGVTSSIPDRGRFHMPPEQLVLCTTSIEPVFHKRSHHNEGPAY